MQQKLVKSRERVRNHAEVYTPKHIVDSMLDLVKNETERIDSRFLEPACGDGNFLAAVLQRKIEVISKKYKGNQTEFELNSVIAVGSIYGVDILEDNIMECRKRLLNVFTKVYRKQFQETYQAQCIDVIVYILAKNILWGDALTMKTVCDKNEPICFAEWASVNGFMVKRRDYRLDKLLEHRSFGEQTLFSDSGEQANIAPILRHYPLAHYLELNQYE